MSTLPSAASPGGRLVTPDGTQLAFRGCTLDVDAGGGLARVVLRQTFVNDFDEPLQVTYQVPLPAEAAIGGYAFELEGRRVVGEIEGRKKAREQFEAAIIEGRSAALLEQERSSVFTQEIGNVPPHTEVTCELVLDQRLRWLEDGQWEWRFPTVIAPRYMGEDGRVPDRDTMSVDVLESGHDARGTLALTVRDASEGDPSSPSHAIRCGSGEHGRDITLAAEGGTPLDRDMVVRWNGASPEPGFSIEVARPHEDRSIADSAYGLVTITPPMSVTSCIPRDLIVLIDTSGSMHGAPLDQAKAVVSRIIDALDDNDTLELIEFSMEANRWRKTARAANATAKKSALAWIKSLDAYGGTEMESGLIEALTPLRDDAQRQVILVSDGLVGFEHDLVNLVKERGASGTRVHSVGVGPAANRSLTSAIARVGGGAEFLVGLDENADEVVQRIVARVSQPLVQNLTIEGDALRERGAEQIPDLMGGCPSLVPVRIDPDGGVLVVRGVTGSGPFEQRVIVPACAHDTGCESIVRLFGRERAEDLDASVPAGARSDESLETIGLAYRIATRCTSWVAISEEPTVDATAPIRRTKIAQSLPAGLSAEGLGLNRARAGRFVAMTRTQAFLPAEYLESPASAPPSKEFFSLSVGEVIRSKRRERRTLEVAATIVSWKDGQGIIEIELVDELEWNPRKVEIPDAPKAKIDKKATTRRGSYTMGQRLRLVIDNLPPDLDPPQTITVIVGARTRLSVKLDVK